MRVPNTPLTTTATWSPGSMRLTKQASMPALPVPDTGMVSAFSVWKTSRSNCCVSDIMDEEVRIQMPEGRRSHGPQHSGRHVAGSGAHEDAGGGIEVAVLADIWS